MHSGCVGICANKCLLLNSMRRNQSILEQEAQLNAPDPRESRPPCYEDAILLPKFSGSFASLRVKNRNEPDDEDEVDSNQAQLRNRSRSEEVLANTKTEYAHFKILRFIDYYIATITGSISARERHRTKPPDTPTNHRRGEYAHFHLSGVGDSATFLADCYHCSGLSARASFSSCSSFQRRKSNGGIEWGSDQFASQLYGSFGTLRSRTLQSVCPASWHFSATIIIICSSSYSGT